MPYGYLIGTSIWAVATLASLAPLRRPRPLAVTSWLLGLVPNEVPGTILLLLAVSTVMTADGGDLTSTGGSITLVFTLVTAAGLVLLLRRATRTGPTVAAALDAAIGPSWRRRTGGGTGFRRRLPWARMLLAPWLMWRADVEHIEDLSYGDAGKRHRLDVYRHRSRPRAGPVLVYFHGGRFRHGAKDREARPLLYHLASRGWLCISANYRLQPEVAFPEHLVDAKRAVAWVRAHAADLGGDRDTVFVAGSSAGAHLAAMLALTPDVPALQPPGEGADTAVAGAICLYGYYGAVAADLRHPGAEVASSPIAHARPDAPPFFVVHGDHDTHVRVEGARRLVAALRASSRSPVVFAELPGAQHSFDVFHSIRFERVVDGVEAFARWVRSEHRRTERSIM